MVVDTDGRDDFTAKTIQELMNRAGARCSVPSCRKHTSGPSSTSQSGVSNVGVAAHISAASENGPRYDESLTGDERKSVHNGLWTCHTHGRMIDNDFVRYPVALLKQWKLDAEERAAKDLEGLDLSDGLYAYTTEVTPVDFRKHVLEFVEDCGLDAQLATRSSRAIARLISETCLNAFEHAGAAVVLLESGPGGVSISHVGPRFGWEDLIDQVQPEGSIRGGARLTLLNIEAEHPGEFVFSYQHVDGVGQWHVASLRHLGEMPNSPCIVTTKRGLQLGDDEYAQFDQCEMVHLLLDHNVMFSDVRRLVAERVGQYVPADRLIIHGLSPNDPLRAVVAEWFPGIRVAAQ